MCVKFGFESVWQNSAVAILMSQSRSLVAVCTFAQPFPQAEASVDKALKSLNDRRSKETSVSTCISMGIVLQLIHQSSNIIVSDTRWISNTHLFICNERSRLRALCILHAILINHSQAKLCILYSHHTLELGPI